MHRVFIGFIVVIFVGYLSFLFCCHFCLKDIHRIPVLFYPFQDLPLVRLEIEGLKCSLLVDSGSSCNIDLQEQVVDKIRQKTLVGTGSRVNIKGENLTLREFLVPSVKMESLTLEKATISELKLPYFSEEGILWPKGLDKRHADQKISHISGKIGRQVFLDWCCYFDLPHSVIFLAKNIEDMSGVCSFDQFVEIPLLLENYGLIIVVETDLGPKRVLLDTGANHSLVRESQVDKNDAKEVYPGIWRYTSSQLKIGDNNFGSWPFLLYEFCDSAKFDAVLGVDFFKKYEVLFDFKKSRVFISLKPYEQTGPFSFRTLEWFFRLFRFAANHKHPV